jgi:hypothetical protein
VARSAGVSPSLFRASRLAPQRKRRCATSMWPPAAARWRAV